MTTHAELAEIVDGAEPPNTIVIAMGAAIVGFKGLRLEDHHLIQRLREAGFTAAEISEHMDNALAEARLIILQTGELEGTPTAALPVDDEVAS
jgi:hypothetical protein